MPGDNRPRAGRGPADQAPADWSAAAGPAGQPDLRADCSRCVGLCCVAPAFSASADFAIDKPAGRPCPNLSGDLGCSIYGRLRQQGFPGCSAYDCFGAGQQVAQVTFGGQDWRGEPQLAGQMFAVFAVMRQLHELLWHLTEALALEPARPLRAELAAAAAETERLTRGHPDDLLSLDVASHWQQVSALLQQASELARADLTGASPDAGRPAGATRRRSSLRGADLRGAQFLGSNLRGTDLRGASLRGACLIGADLRRADLRRADLAGADLRGAELGGADLAESIFLTQAQIDAASGDQATRLPLSLTRPAHWPVPARSG
jgi:uncharacterized protein YjbI with pentapeptide repeats